MGSSVTHKKRIYGPKGPFYRTVRRIMRIKHLYLLFLILSSGLLMAKEIPEGADEILRSEIGYPPTQETLHFHVAKTEEKGVFVLEVYEGLEYYLGEQLFENLVDMFSGIDGVSEVEHADREIFILVSNGSELGELKESLWQVILNASQFSFMGQKNA